MNITIIPSISNAGLDQLLHDTGRDAKPNRDRLELVEVPAPDLRAVQYAMLAGDSYAAFHALNFNAETP